MKKFARDLTGYFALWCSALKVETFEDLSKLIMLERFKNSIPDSIAQHINGLKVKSVTEVASLVDDYVLMHKHSFGEWHSHAGTHGNFGGGSGQLCWKNVMGEVLRKCTYCHKKGHFKAAS